MARKKKETSKLLYDENTWTFDKIRRVDDAISEIALKELKLDIYPNQIEIIGSDQMLEAYASHGLPIMYHHWSFGKSFIMQEQQYRQGKSGLAYEIVINSSPCISYLMEENSMTMQTLVIAHAAYGHNHFFKNNYLFRQWTDAESIIDYLIFARDYIKRCEERYGEDKVEELLNCLHSIMMHGVDKYKRPSKLNKEQEKARQEERAEYVQSQANLLWSTLPPTLAAKEKKKKDKKKIPSEPQENLLYFIEKNSPILESWEREIVRIVRKIAQYFYPQFQTKLMNEGWATFTHYYIMNRLWENGQISDGNMLEFLKSHAGVLQRYPFNPYALGFDMFTEIRRVCEHPTDKDRELFPHLAGEPWLDVCLDAVVNYRDQSFIRQFLTPNTIQKWRMFEVLFKEDEPFVEITAIQNDTWFQQIKNSLAEQHSMDRWLPDIQVVDANVYGDRTLSLEYRAKNGQHLINDKVPTVLYNIKRLWGYPVELKEVKS